MLSEAINYGAVLGDNGSRVGGRGGGGGGFPFPTSAASAFSNSFLRNALFYFSAVLFASVHREGQGEFMVFTDLPCL